jgi:hypothetical protein
VDDRLRWVGLACGMTLASGRRLGVLTVATLSVVVTLAGCASFGINTVETGHYGTAEEARSSSNGYQIPQLVPEDATNVRIAYNTVDGGVVLSFDTEAVTADYCKPGDIETTPELIPSWWPETGIPNEGLTCGTWTAVEKDGTFLAWD